MSKNLKIIIIILGIILVAGTVVIAMTRNVNDLQKSGEKEDYSVERSIFSNY